MGFRYRKSINLGGGFRIDTPDASIGEQYSMFRTVCSHKVIALGFNTLCYDAERRGISHILKSSATKDFIG